MRPRWRRHNDGQDTPVEMRFIDMFMTAFGSLVFLALLLVFLLPKSASDPTRESVPRKQLEDALSNNQLLQSRIDGLQLRVQELIVQMQKAEQNWKEEDRHIVKRWFSVVLLTSGCKASEPELHVRYEGKVVDFDTGQPLPDALPFDPSNPGKKTIFVGHRYFDVGSRRGHAKLLPSLFAWSAPSRLSEPESTAVKIDALQKNGLQLKTFYGVSRGSGPWSVYAALSDPKAQGGTECIVNPIYLTSAGLIGADQIELNQYRPFAWLHRMTMSKDGVTTFDKKPSVDDSFKRDLLEFSRAQSDLLCKRRSLCGVMDAHLAILIPSKGAKTSSQHERGLKAGDSFQECDVCPSMIMMPAGSFLIGSPDTEKDRNSDESPHFQVTIARQFAVGKYAVTFDEWDACVADGSCDHRPKDENWGRGSRPVINVSWHDAKTYVAWLSRKTGKQYRLLTDAEREYVTRAGTTTPFWWGGASLPTRANYDGNFTYGGNLKGSYQQKTVPVDLYEPNPWGLYQVHGNVWEWVEDCWISPRQISVADSSAWVTDNCPQRVRRGGSWRNHPQFLRSAVRGPSIANGRYNNIGFRVARTIDSATE